MPAFSVLIFLMLLTAPAQANEDIQPSIISLDASASREVENDKLLVRLEVIESGSDTARLTGMVNQKSALVLDAVKNFQAIEVETSSYQTQPIYEKGKIISWQVSQQLTLETEHFEQMSQLTAVIGAIAHIQSMQFKLSTSKDETVKQELLKEAIAKFKSKAELVANQFERSGYVLLNLSIDSNTIDHKPRLEKAYSTTSSIFSQHEPVVLVNGKSHVRLTVKGKVQLNSK